MNNTKRKAEEEQTAKMKKRMTSKMIMATTREETRMTNIGKSFTNLGQSYITDI